jgi:hypothetical protein
LFPKSKEFFLNIISKFFFCQEIEEKNRKAVNDKDIVPNNDFREKYEKLIGRDAGKSAAQVTTPNKQFGFGK